MGATVENSSGFGVIGKPEYIKRISRKIRPYRHAYIKLSKPSAGTLSYEYINNINEFGSNLVNRIVDDTGSYQIILNSGLFKNITNVIQDVDFIHTSSVARLLLTSAFNGSKSQLNITSFDVDTYNNTDIEGELLVIIREFYE